MKQLFNFTFLIGLIGLSSLGYADTDYSQFIRMGALKAYADKSPQLRIVAKFDANPAQVHLERKEAAQLAIDSEKCDFVVSSEVVGDAYLEYEVICKNGAIIYLTQYDLHEGARLDAVIPEKEKALPRAIARSRCEQLVLKDVKNKGYKQNQLKIDRYKISTLITELGETIVRIGYTIKAKGYIAECSFSQNNKLKFVVKDS